MDKYVNKEEFKKNSMDVIFSIDTETEGYDSPFLKCSQGTPEELLNSICREYSITSHRYVSLEKEMLKRELAELDEFMNSDEYLNTNEIKKALLIAQVSMMDNYKYILNLRYTDAGANDIFLDFKTAMKLVSKGFIMCRDFWDGIYIMEDENKTQCLCKKCSNNIDFKDSKNIVCKWELTLKDALANDWKIVCS